MSDQPDQPTHEFHFEAIGTHWTIQLYSQPATTSPQELLRSIHERIEQFDKTYSRFRDDSLISMMAHEAGSYQLPADAKPLLDIYQRLYEQTDGAMTPLVGQLLSDAGYDAGYSLHPGELHQVPDWQDILDYQFPTLTLRRPALLDFGAAGKGYLVDLICRLLDENGISSYIVDAGGDIRQRDIPTSIDRIGLEHPGAPGQVVGVASIGNRSLCGSAGNRRTWGQGQAADGGDLHHIMNPHSLRPVRRIAGLWVVAGEGLIADALATALFFVPPERLTADYSFEYLIMYDTPDPDQGSKVDRSAGFPAELFLA